MNKQRNACAAAPRRSARFPAKVRATAAVLVCMLLAGCSILGGGDRRPPTLFAPDPRVATDPAWPSVGWQLALGTPSGARVIDSYRIAVRPTPGELQVYKGARWAKSPGEMLQDSLLRALEDSGRLPAVARQGAGVAADYKLLLDLRRFEADYTGATVPAATIEVNAKLVHAKDQSVVASRTFVHAEPAGSVDVARVADAFGEGLGRISHDIAGWVLATGAAHDARVQR
jgi:cholesterol transport system auxiliary component